MLFRGEDFCDVAQGAGHKSRVGLKHDRDFVGPIVGGKGHLPHGHVQVDDGR